ncbi:MAG: phosphatidate cytidylyltransferase [Bacteroidales bacterium]|nr:phosphatidate cytidylyltransferase [Bacteroidales bacterium]
MKTSNLLIRSLTGLIYSLIIISAVLLYDYYVFTVLFFIVNIFAIYEFYKLVEKDQIYPQKINGIIISSLVFILSAIYVFISGPYFDKLFHNSGFHLIALYVFLFSLSLVFLIIIPLYLFIIELYRKKGKPFSNVAFTLLGIIYITVPLSLLNLIPEFTEIKYILLWIFLLIWAYDTFAYLIGSRFGNKKLIPRISPKKSWAGLIGGSFATIILSFIIFYFFNTKEEGFYNFIILAFLIIIACTFGDLIESLFKRSIDIKDSGNFLPGHGGLLDRFDSLLFAAPLVFIYYFILFIIY